MFLEKFCLPSLPARTGDGEIPPLGIMSYFSDVSGSSMRASFMVVVVVRSLGELMLWD